jgi:damage-control phosphatase, subfamily I
MKTFLDCMPCFVRQALDSAKLATDDEQVHEQVVRETLRLAVDLDMSQSPPAIGQKIHRLIRKLIGNNDPYHSVKEQFNNLALKLYPELEKRVRESEDPFATSVRLAIAGNIIDFGVKTSLAELDVEKTIEQSLTSHFDDNQIQEFKDAVMQAEKILYLADNAGEIVLDRLLIEQLPIQRVAVVVKGEPVINDATMEDAKTAGLTEIVEVIDNGSDAPGTIIETCSQAFRDRFEDTDLIIAKGQGNYETLSGIDKNIFFILKAKCPVIASNLGCEVGEMILRNNSSIKVNCRKDGYYAKR